VTGRARHADVVGEDLTEAGLAGVGHQGVAAGVGRALLGRMGQDTEHLGVVRLGARHAP